MDRAPVRPSGPLRFSILLCFFLSGASGLIYEVVWMRTLGLVFGHTVFAITTVLVAFMTGLALGAYLFGNLIDRRGRPLRVYGFLEAGIGLYILLIPSLFLGAQNIYLWLYRSFELSFYTFTLAQFVLVFFILLVPTTFMGASLPVLAKFFVDRLDGVGRKIGDLYAINTFGAVLGSGAAGFFLLPAIGVKATTLLAAAINLGIGLWAMVADRWALKSFEASAAPANAVPEAGINEVSRSVFSPLMTWLVLAGIGLSGASSMVYEIAWTRALRLAIASSIYAFSAMLTTFLVGLALGSFLFARIWGKRSTGAKLFGWIEIAIGFSALALIPVFERLPDFVLAILKQFALSATGALLAQFGLSFLVMIVPTTLIGAAFPCAVQACAQAAPRVAGDVGRVYSVNTVGTIVGAVLAGFLLIPTLGAQASMVTAAAINVAVGAILFFVCEFNRGDWVRTASLPILIVFAAVVWILPEWDRRIMVGGVSVYAQRYLGAEDSAKAFRVDASSQRLLYYREGLNATVAVRQGSQMRALSVDGKADASNGPDMMTQLMLGHLPLFFHPNPKTILVIGLGSGVTAGAVAAHPEAREIDVVEMEPAVVEASNFFIAENRAALRDPRVRLVIGDGRNFILASEKKYDVISSEPSNPWMAGVANLFSLEFYRLARQQLAANGIMVQWVQGYSLFPRDFKMIVNTFRQVFPHSTLWRTVGGDYLLVGTLSPLRLDYALIKEKIERSAAIQEDMKLVHLESPLDVLTLFLLDEADLAGFAAAGAVNRDDRPFLEFSAPLALYADTTDTNRNLLAQARNADLPPIANLPQGLLEQRRVYFARVYWARGETEEALKELRRAQPPRLGDIALELERAKLLFSLGEMSQAMEALTAIAQVKPNDPLIRSYLKVASILPELKAEDSLLKHGRTLLGNPNPAEAHNNLGVFYTRLGVRSGETAFFDLAVDSLEAALRLEPEAYTILNNLGAAYFESGKLAQAAEAYKKVVTFMPDLAEARFNLGLVHEKRQEFTLAIREYESASALKPHWELPRSRLGMLRNEFSERSISEKSPRSGARVP